VAWWYLALTLKPNSDLEAVIYTQLAPGAYTAIVFGVGGAIGVGIVEVFEIGKAETITATAFFDENIES